MNASYQQARPAQAGLGTPRLALLFERALNLLKVSAAAAPWF
jgi:hypothetical protein